MYRRSLTYGFALIIAYLSEIAWHMSTLQYGPQKRGVRQDSDETLEDFVAAGIRLGVPASEIEQSIRKKK